MVNRQLLASLPFLCSDDPTPLIASSYLILNQQILLIQALLTYNRSVQVQGLNPRPRPEQGGQRITAEFLFSLSNRECIWRFRFFSFEILELVIALDVPDPFITQSQYNFTAVEALSLLLARFRSGNDLFEICSRYDRCESSLSEVINELSEYLDKRWKHLLDCDQDGILHPDQLAIYADAIAAHGASLHNCVAFLDCTLRRNTRPILGQAACYSGYKKCHMMKYQALIIPNGLIAHLAGPYEGRRNDNHLLTSSQILIKFAQFAFQFAFRPDLPDNAPAPQRNFVIFGDPAYGYGPHLASPFARDNLSEDEKAWNAAMSKCHIEVEHAFGVVVTLWPFLNIFRKMQIFSSPVGRYYRVGVLLTNVSNCLRPNQISQAFDLLPPTLDEYLHD